MAKRRLIKNARYHLGQIKYYAELGYAGAARSQAQPHWNDLLSLRDRAKDGELQLIQAMVTEASDYMKTAKDRDDESDHKGPNT